MGSITSREQFFQVLDDAERVTAGLVASARAQRRQLLTVLAKHLAFARNILRDGAWPTAEQQAAVKLAGVAAQLGPGGDGADTDPHTAWLCATLPLLDEFFRSIEPLRIYAWGDHVVVPWPSGQRFLGFIRFVHEQTYLVAFGNGSQQWLQATQIQPGPAPGQPMIALGPDGQQLQGTLAERAEGRYRLDLPDGSSDWFEWTHVQPA